MDEMKKNTIANGGKSDLKKKSGDFEMANKDERALLITFEKYPVQFHFVTFPSTISFYM